jgi:hypothetical protein
MTEHLPGFALDGSLMRAWLALAAAEGPDDPGPLAAALPAIGYGWRPDLPGGAAAAEALVRLAAQAGILACPAGVTAALQHYGRTYRVLVTVRGPGGAAPLTMASRPRPLREIGQPGTCGPDAAAHVLAEVTATANDLLGSLASYPGPAATAGAPGVSRR